MGISFSPDTFQENMSSLMQHLEFLKTYLDDLLFISSSSFEDHLHKIEVVLTLISEHGLCINTEKSMYFADEIEYLGYWITKTVIQPVLRKSNQ
jgi:hypothetical protein